MEGVEKHIEQLESRQKELLTELKEVERKLRDLKEKAGYEKRACFDCTAQTHNKNGYCDDCLKNYTK